MRLSLSGPQFPKLISQHVLRALKLEDSEISGLSKNVRQLAGHPNALGDKLKKEGQES